MHAAYAIKAGKMPAAGIFRAGLRCSIRVGVGGRLGSTTLSRVIHAARRA